MHDLVGALNEALGRRLPAAFRPGSAGVAYLTLADRSVSVLDLDGTYSLSFGWRGRQQAHGSVSDPAAIADAARRWVEGAGLESLAAAHPFVKYSGLQLAYERGNALDYQWAALLEAVDGDYSSFRELAVLASQNEVLRRLFPQWGHRLALFPDEFSDRILVAVFAHRPGWYVVYAPGDDPSVEFEGAADRMVDYLVTRFRDQTGS
ncbi:hypothetical protein JIG36_36440 [Actinoplanes sp. LDG1-06]|uniref:Uncharacterized protein n=1 Tax=Paractinoplanes ovalisporus TaxID=2810368 RepID=A0ABS2AP55_9ACTN|nr:hypothetical protein [Actinoplanes ovalisporus]MBM2621004.1 hypothetical protein [Actinoplanes ovalisporus]